MTPEEQGTRNIELLGRYLEHLLDHPEQLADVAGEVVLIPSDDPELATANTGLRVEVARATAAALPAVMVGGATLSAEPAQASTSLPSAELVRTPPSPRESS